MKTSDLVFIGIKGSVVALNRTTGKQVWVTRLKGSDFVNIVVQNEQCLPLVTAKASDGDKVFRQPSVLDQRFAITEPFRLCGISFHSPAKGIYASTQQRSSHNIPAFAGTTIWKRFCHPSSNARWF